MFTLPPQAYLPAPAAAAPQVRADGFPPQA
jgi:hypothetical protein